MNVVLEISCFGSVLHFYRYIYVLFVVDSVVTIAFLGETLSDLF